MNSYLSRVDYGLAVKDSLKDSSRFDRPQIKRSKMFEKEALDKIIQNQLANVPQHHTIAMVSVVNGDGEKFAIAYKPNEEWEIQGYVEHTNKTGLGYGASVQWSR